ncbi:ATP-binding protein [bacterium]|nr:MAG: ATP-binding protein [bacterium]
MEDLSLHILDISENSIRAGATEIGIEIVENVKENILLIEIHDNGKGMSEEMVKQVSDPFFTTKTTRRIGLGIPFLIQAARETMGDVDIKTGEGKGTTITARFQYNHIDRKPLGDMEKTMSVLIASNPDIDFSFHHIRNNRSFTLKTAEIRKKLEGIPINAPQVIKYIKDDIREWLNETKSIIVGGITKHRKRGQ